MAGIYIHIPFCRKLCYYCDFFFTVSMKNKDALVEALLIETDHKRSYLNNTEFETLYFGGGTPSVLNIDEINKIFTAINKNFNIAKNAEITFEANPDDLSEQYLRNLKNLSPINRLSIGIQSFKNNHLKLMNRRHTAEEAEQSVMRAQQAGFDNINIDLIYGIPGMNSKDWEFNLSRASHLNIQHISAYHLTYEPKTVFSNFIKKGKIKPVSEKQSLNQFQTLLDWASANNFAHYEISNFGRERFFSKHNLNYWNQGSYIGIGPSAHSYDGSSRQWNVSNITNYIKSMQSGEIYFEKEELSTDTKYNEYLLTSLRTMWGVTLEHIEKEFGVNYKNNFLRYSEKFILNNEIRKEGKIYTITQKGKLISDFIISELMLVK
ncbi:MAG: radical SAM family heme chaperone HemW [Bacteroidales bacterium]|nr:radical SAM family heme chaperone HemW [Bacteroidales bacterium]